MAATRSVFQIIQRAGRTSGVIATGETLSADEQNDALLCLNQMMDAWQADRLYAYSIQDITFPLTQGVSTYTIGPAGTFATARPEQIDYAYTRDSTGFDRSINILPAEVFALIGLKSVSNTFPTCLLYTPNYPLGSIQFYPVPSAGLVVHLGLWAPLSEFATVAQVVSLPPGYEDAIVYSLAERLSLDNAIDIGPDLAKQAQTARARIQGNNLPDMRIACEFGGMGSNLGATYAEFVAGF
jgi:hypothetical protein